jgi:hypothetical protein
MKIAVFFALVVTSTVVAWPNEFLDSDTQDGFEPGLAPELHGVWLGDEKYKAEDGSIEDYCSSAIFHPTGYLTWESVPGTCQAAGTSPAKKRVGGNWFELIEFPAYVYRFRQKKCLPKRMCGEDITKDHDPTDQTTFKGWTVLAKACGAHLKDDQMTENTYTCEQYQVNLISRGNKRLLVVVLSYRFFEDGFSNYECPRSGPSFLARNLKLPNDGSARFVLQSAVNETIFDPCTWDCFDDPKNTFKCGK